MTERQTDVQTNRKTDRVCGYLNGERKPTESPTMISAMKMTSSSPAESCGVMLALEGNVTRTYF